MTNQLSRPRRQFDILKFKAEDDWLLHRKFGIGASEAPALLGLSRWSNPLQLWGEKTGILEHRNLDSIMLRTGHALETLNSEVFEENTQLEAYNPGEYTIYQNRNVPYLFCTPDRVVAHCEWGKGICELKRSNMGIVERPEYYVQIQHSLAVTGYDWGCVCVLAMDDWQWFRYDRNEEFIRNLLHVYEEFWYHVVTKTMPIVEPTQAVNDTMKLIYRKDDGSHVVLSSDEFKDVDAEYTRLSEELKAANKKVNELKAERDKLECRFREAIGTSQSAEIDGVVYTLDTTYRKPQEATSFRTLKRKQRKEE